MRKITAALCAALRSLTKAVRDHVGPRECHCYLGLAFLGVGVGVGSAWWAGLATVGLGLFFLGRWP